MMISNTTPVLVYYDIGNETMVVGSFKKDYCWSRETWS